MSWRAWPLGRALSCSPQQSVSWAASKSGAGKESEFGGSLLWIEDEADHQEVQTFRVRMGITWQLHEGTDAAHEIAVDLNNSKASDRSVGILAASYLDIHLRLAIE